MPVAAYGDDSAFFNPNCPFSDNGDMYSNRSYPVIIGKSEALPAPPRRL